MYGKGADRHHLWLDRNALHKQASVPYAVLVNVNQIGLCPSDAGLKEPGHRLPSVLMVGFLYLLVLGFLFRIFYRETKPHGRILYVSSKGKGFRPVEDCSVSVWKGRWISTDIAASDRPSDFDLVISR